MESFSRRNMINIEPIEITIRFDAPTELREWLFCLIKRLKYSIKSFRDIVCQMSYQTANPNQWGENSYMEEEIRELLDNCQWNNIYDIIEETYRQIPMDIKEDYTSSLNDFFYNKGYGWKLENGQVLSRGDGAFEESISSAVTCVKDTNPDAFYEIREALVDISKRPEPDVTGAVQHSMAAVECLCKQLTGTPNDTLGKIINDNREKFPSPLDSALHHLWGFASNHGRHVIEGKSPTFEEAELVVHICASIIPYLKATITD